MMPLRWSIWFGSVWYGGVGEAVKRELEGGWLVRMGSGGQSVPLFGVGDKVGRQ